MPTNSFSPFRSFSPSPFSQNLSPVLLAFNLPNPWLRLLLQKRSTSLKKALKITGRILLGLLLLLVLAWGFLQTDFGQNWLARQVTGKLSKELQTKVSIKHISIGFFNRLELEGFYLEDQKKDTLLYAGALKVRITDWFFFKDKAELEYIGLDDAVIHLNRTDSAWNYGFLTDYFASSDTTKSPAPKKEAGIQFDLKKVVLNNIRFVQKDAWKGSDMTVQVGYLNLDADKISLMEKAVRIRNVEINNPYFSTLSYPGKFKDTTSTAFDWDIRFDAIRVNNGRFRMDKDTYTPTVAYFDGAHMDFSGITGTVRNFSFIKDTLKGAIDLATKERSGFTVQQLKTNLTIQPKGWEFANLLLQTPRSKLSDHFALRFESSAALADFIHAVTLDANFNQAAISSDDLAYFIPDAKAWKKAIRINGKVEGQVDGFSSEKLELWLGNNTYVNGSVSVVGLPDIKQTLLNIDAKDLRTTYADAASFFPGLRRISNPNVQALRYLNFKGSFTGFVNDFVSYGTLQTALGTLTTDINMKLPANGEPVYSGSLNTDGFQLGRFINNPKLGIVDFRGTVKGRGFDLNRININVDGDIDRVQWDNYTYQNIKSKGIITRQRFNGRFVMKDPNADLEITGLVDFSGTQPVFDATAQIRTANLKALQLTTDDIRLKGDFNLNMQGSNLSNLIGTARISNAELFANGQQLSFDFLNIASYYINDTRNLSVSSNEFDGKVSGNFDLATLPSAFRHFLSRYYPSYIKAPDYFAQQDFQFDINTGIVQDYIRLIDPKLSGLDNSRLVGSLNTTTNSMTIDADVPLFKYDKYTFTTVKLQGRGDLDSLVLTGSAQDADLGGGILLPETSFSIRAANDVSDIVLNTTSNQAINKASLSARVNTYNDGVALQFSPSSFMLNGKQWTIVEGGELNLRSSTMANGLLVLREGEQEIRIETVPDYEGTWNNLVVTLDKLNLGDLAPLFLKDNKLEGTLSGTATLRNPTEKLTAEASFEAAGLKLDNDSLGNVHLTSTYNNITGLLTVTGNNTDTAHRIDFDVAMNLKDTANTFQDRITLRPTNFQLSILERFLGTLFTDIEGYVTGLVNILGEGTDRTLSGKMALRGAAMKVVFTQVAYTIEDTELIFEPEYLNLNGLRLRDRKGNEARITGGIKHKFFQNMEFDLAVQTVSPQMELINTTYKDNQQFYGRAWGSGSFVLIGPQYDMDMFIDMKASNTDTSYITLPPAPTRQSSLASFLVERKYGREMTETESRGGTSNINYEVKLQATPLVYVEMIIDETTGDVIRGRGTGNITLNSGTNTPLRLNGRFNIEEGEYNFTFQSVFDRKFVVRKNVNSNNYIEWSGDPYDANINLEAYYTAKAVSFSPLASSLIVDAAASQTLARIRDDVDVLARITGKLFAPKIDFKLEFPNNSVVFSQPSISFAIEQLQRNSAELTKQVTFLVVTNSFAPYESSQNLATPFQELAYNTISGVLFNAMNRVLNNVFSEIFRGTPFTLNLSGSLYNRNLVNTTGGFQVLPDQATSTLTVGVALLKGRVLLNLGGSFDVPVGQNLQQTFQILPDVQLDVLLNTTGTLRATLFYRRNLDYLNGFNAGGGNQASRYGASFSYNKEFDSFWQVLFGKKKGEVPKPPAAAANTPAGTVQQLNMQERKR